MIVAMTAWDFSISDMGILGGHSVSEESEAALPSGISILDQRVPPPWDYLEGFAETDDDRSYAWEISTLGAHLTLAEGSGDATRSPQPLHELGRDDLFVHPRDMPIVLVEASSFGPDLLHLLQYSPPVLRPRWLYPMLTDEEDAWLDDLETADLRHQLPLAMDALTAAFGQPVRIEARQALRAADVLLAAGFVIQPDALFRAHRNCFSTRARAIIRAILAERQSG